MFIHMPLTWGWLEPLGSPWSPMHPSLAPPGQLHSMWLSGKHTLPSLRGSGCVLRLSSFMDLEKRSVPPLSSPGEGAFSFSLETSLKGQAANPGFIRVLILCKKCARALHRLQILYGLILGPHYEIIRGSGDIVALINRTSPTVHKA